MESLTGIWEIGNPGKNFSVIISINFKIYAGRLYNNILSYAIKVYIMNLHAA